MNYLSFEKTKEQNAIEMEFCIPFSKAIMSPMSDQLARICFMMLMNPEANIPELEESFIYRMLDSRLQCFTFKMSKPAKYFVSALCESPGDVVMYLTYLQYLASIRSRRDLDMEFVRNEFPVGFPGSEELHRLWLGQKVSRDHGSDNLLDYGTAMKSITKIPQK